MKTLVNLISKQTVPNYLFIREKLEDEDMIMFICSQDKDPKNDMRPKMQYIKNALSDIDSNRIIEIILDEGVEEDVKAMSNAILPKIPKCEKYLVNLTGGTKLMALTAYNLFNDYNTEYFYLPYPKNYLIKLPEGEIVANLSDHLTVSDFLKLYGHVGPNSINPNPDYEYLKKIFDKITTCDDSNFINKPLEFLRNKIDELNNKKKKNKKPKIVISDVENCLYKWSEESDELKPLKPFLEYLEFPYKDNQLTKHEAKFLTGGWFEEYSYCVLKEVIQPKSMTLNFILKNPNNEKDPGNEFDVLFTKGNKLFYIECKTYVGSKLLANTAAKSTALKEYLGGLAVNPYIFSLSDNSHKERVSQFNVYYFSFTDPESSIEDLIKDINEKAN